MGAPLSAYAVLEADEENIRRKRQTEKEERIKEAEKAAERHRRIDYPEKPADTRNLLKF